jgi:hypothetical protein
VVYEAVVDGLRFLLHGVPLVFEDQTVVVVIGVAGDTEIGVLCLTVLASGAFLA